MLACIPIGLHCCTISVMINYNVGHESTITTPHHCLDDHFPIEPGLASPPWFHSSTCPGAESLGIIGTVLVWVACPSRYPTTNIKAVKETQSTDPCWSAWLHPFSPTTGTSEGSVTCLLSNHLQPLCTLYVSRHHQLRTRFCC